MIIQEQLQECASTSDRAREIAAAGAPHGSWVCAEQQTQGRGRMGRVWASEPGNLHLSIVLRPFSLNDPTWVPLAIACGVADGLSALGVKSVAIKWPNDLWCRGRKVGGILCESSGGSSGAFIVVGIGINVLHTPPLAAGSVAATSLKDEKAKVLDVASVRDEVVRSVMKFWAVFERQGAAVVRERYAAIAAFPVDTEVSWLDGAQEGKIRGLGRFGELLVQIATGETIALYAEDVSVRASRRASDGSPA